MRSGQHEAADLALAVGDDVDEVLAAEGAGRFAMHQPRSRKRHGRMPALMRDSDGREGYPANSRIN